MTAAFNWSSEDVTRYFSNSLSHTILDYNGIGIYYPMYDDTRSQYTIVVQFLFFRQTIFLRAKILS